MNRTDTANNNRYNKYNKNSKYNKHNKHNKQTFNQHKFKTNELPQNKQFGCPVVKKCGGCNYLLKEYHDTLEEKQIYLRKLLKEFGKVEPIIGMENPFHYRNKVHAVFGHKRNGEIISGTYEADTHRIVNVDTCMIDNEKADQIIYDIRGLLKSFKIKTYNEDNGYGLFRHVLVRYGEETGEYMVVLVLGSPIMPSKNNFVKALRKLHPEITTIVVNVNDMNTSMVLGEKEQIIYGPGFIMDVLCGLKFRISSKSFYQINHKQTEVLYKKALEFAELTGKERVIDAYCGIGTIGLIASKQAKEVIGIELNKDAVKDAIVNCKLNGIKNTRFYSGDAGEFMVGMAKQQEQADVVFMDPPRAGSDEAFLSSVVQLAPKRVVYISCNPETLARDLKFLCKHGYEVKKIQPVDLFCWTSHVETVCLLGNRNVKPDTHVKLSLDTEELQRVKNGEK